MFFVIVPRPAAAPRPGRRRSPSRARKPSRRPPRPTPRPDGWSLDSVLLSFFPFE
jgi:hypothetical protein